MNLVHCMSNGSALRCMILVVLPVTLRRDQDESSLDRRTAWRSMSSNSPWTLEFRPVLLHGVPVDRDPQTGFVGHLYVAAGIDGERLLDEVPPEG